MAATFGALHHFSRKQFTKVIKNLIYGYTDVQCLKCDKKSKWKDFLVIQQQFSIAVGIYHFFLKVEAQRSLKM